MQSDELKEETLMLFTEEEDQKQFESIYNILKTELRQIPNGPLQYIAEFAVGSIEKCNVSSCEKEIPVSLGALTQYQKATPLHSNAILLGFKYCQWTPAYWCDEHMNEIIVHPRCKNDGLFDPMINDKSFPHCYGC